MHSPRVQALVRELDALQASRARLFLHLALLTDVCDVIAFIDTLADAATLHAKTDRSKQKRAQ